jgi:1,4-dihydroxy-2-naphthoyl-CoA hydrolase
MVPDWLEPKSLAAAQAKFSHRIAVRFQDVDAAKVVFFAKLFDYFHDAYVSYLEVSGLPLDGVLERGEWGAPLRHAEADFLGPIRFGDLVDVGIVGVSLGEGKYTVGYRLALGGSRQSTVGAVVAVGHTCHVVVEGGVARPTRRPIPDELLRVLAPLSLDPG